MHLTSEKDAGALLEGEPTYMYIHTYTYVVSYVLKESVGMT